VPRWSFTKNHYMMHGQQNIKFCNAKQVKQKYRRLLAAFTRTRLPRYWFSNCRLRKFTQLRSQTLFLQPTFRFPCYYHHYEPGSFQMSVFAALMYKMWIHWHRHWVHNRFLSCIFSKVPESATISRLESATFYKL